MSYSLSATIVLGAGNTGLTLTASLFDSANASAAGLTTSTLVEVTAGSGTYLWTGTVPDAHRGYLRFDSSGTFKSAISLNAQEVENPDVKTSTRSSHTAADVWAAGTRTLTSFGTLVADVATAVWAAVTRTLTSGAAPSAAVVAGAVWDEARAGHLTPGTFGGASAVLRDGTAQAGGASTITLDAGASAANNFYANNILAIKAGTGAGQANIIASYVGATKIATMAGAWVTVPDNTSVFVILPLGTIPGASAPSAATVAAAVWDEPRSSHLALGSFGIAEQIVRDGQAQAGSSTTLTLDAGASAVDGFYANDVILLKVGTGAGQVNIIASYVGATKVATLLVPWVVTPDATSCFAIQPLALIPGASNLSAATIWSYATRTLTQAIAAVTPPPLIQGTTVTVLRGETIILPFTGLGDLSARTKLWLTVKGSRNQPDSAALFQILEGTGLVVLNRAAATAGQGSLTVTNAVTGALSARLEAAAAALLEPADHYYYDLQMLSPAGVKTLTRGVFVVEGDVTRSTS